MWWTCFFVFFVGTCLFPHALFFCVENPVFCKCWKKTGCLRQLANFKSCAVDTSTYIIIIINVVPEVGFAHLCQHLCHGPKKTKIKQKNIGQRCVIATTFLWHPLNPAPPSLPSLQGVFDVVQIVSIQQCVFDPSGATFFADISNLKQGGERTYFWRWQKLEYSSKKGGM